MTGLEKIINRIIEDGNKEAEAIRKKAEAEASEVLRESEESLGRLRKEAEEKAEALKKQLQSRTESSAALKKRQALLAAKQDMINETIEKAYRSLQETEEAEYFALIGKMAEQFCQAKDGEIRFSDRDLRRLPEGFAEKIEEIARNKGGSLEVSGTSCQVDGGFVLVYGGVEENCSFEALFAAKKDELSDLAYGLLFGKE